MKTNLSDTLYMIWTIAVKDIVDAIKNKTILSLTLMLCIMLFLPSLIKFAIDMPKMEIAVLDEGDSAHFNELKASESFTVQQVSNREELEQAVGSSGWGLGTEAGLIIPTGFDQALESGDTPQINGVIAWANRGKAEEVQAELSDNLTAAFGQPIEVEIEGNYAYPPVEKPGSVGALTRTSIHIIILLGMMLIPHIMLEEKQAKTMDALLTSPASYGEVVGGKALAGAFYLLVSCVILYALNNAWVVKWGLALVFTFCAIAFTVPLGLLLGSVFNSVKEMGSWALIIIGILIVPSYLVVLAPTLPNAALNAARWMPLPVLETVFLSSISSSIHPRIWVGVGVLLAVSAALYGLVWWRVRLMDR